MTNQEKEQKIQKVEEEIHKVELKIAALAIQRDNLLLRKSRLQDMKTHEPKVLTDEERAEQSRRDRENYLKELQVAQMNINFNQ